MPFTPYHFGPGGFLGLVFRKYIDLPVFVLANVIVDIEVLFATGWPHHRHWHWHTLLIGSAVGALWGLAAYPLRKFFKSMMESLRLPYQTGSLKMVLSGILGVWLHVLIDSIYHYDVQPFWPYRRNPLHEIISRQNVPVVCAIFFIPALVLYIRAVRAQANKKSKNTTQKAS